MRLRIRSLLESAISKSPFRVTNTPCGFHSSAVSAGPSPLPIKPSPTTVLAMYRGAREAPGVKDAVGVAVGDTAAEQVGIHNANRVMRRVRERVF